MIGWLLWNTLRVLAGLGLTILGGSVVLLIWFMFEVGLAWVSFAAIGGTLLLALLLLRSLPRRDRSGLVE